MTTTKTKISPIEGRHVSAVYQAIADITDALSKSGISKSQLNKQQAYPYRGIDDIYNALAPELAKNQLCILPQVLERSCEERQTAKGGALFYVTVRVRFDFVSAKDGSTAEVVTLGEAMDSGDKATNKAMSAAYKYAAMMAFCIPTIGEDTETETHEVRSRSKAAPEPTREQLMERATHMAQAGSFSLRTFWFGLRIEQQKMLKPLLDTHLKPIAEAADRANEPNPVQDAEPQRGAGAEQSAHIRRPRLEQNPEDSPPARSRAGVPQTPAAVGPPAAAAPVRERKPDTVRQE